MIVTVTPVGREPFDLALDGTPTWDDKSSGGYGDANIPCVLMSGQAERILNAAVRITGTAGDCYAGDVWDYSEGGLSCAGKQSRLGLKERHALYATTAFLQGLREYNGTNWGIFYRSITGGIMYVGQDAGTTSTISDRAGYEYISDVPLDRIEFTGGVNHVAINLEVWKYASSTWTLVYSKSTAGTSTGQTADLDGAYRFAVMGAMAASVTPTDTAVHVAMSSAVLYGVSYSTTPANLFDAMLDRTAGLSTSRAWIASDEAALTDLDVDGSDADASVKILETTGRQFGVRLRDVGWTREPVGIYEARPTTPAYLCTHDGSSVIVSLSGGSMDDLFSEIRGRYRDTDGNWQTVTVADTDLTHYLVKLGMTGDSAVSHTITVDTTSSVVATAAATAYLAAHSVITHSGTVKCIGPVITTATGAPVDPTMVESGKVVTVFATRHGDITGYIDLAKHVGADEVTPTIDNSLRIPESLRRIIR